MPLYFKIDNLRYMSIEQSIIKIDSITHDLILLFNQNPLTIETAVKIMVYF